MNLRNLASPFLIVLLLTQTVSASPETLLIGESEQPNVIPILNPAPSVPGYTPKQAPTTMDFLEQSKTLSKVEELELKKKPAEKRIAIRNVEDLKKIENDMSGHYYLTRDIDASETANWNGGLGFDPIGSWDNSFLGTFDGNGFKIKNLTINRPDESYVGLFASLGENSKVENLELKNVFVHGSYNVGTIAGYMFLGSVDNLSVKGGVVRGGGATGGLIGQIYNGKGVFNSHTDLPVIGMDEVGGIVGRIWDGIGNDVVDSSALGSVSGQYFVGGLAGFSKSADMIRSFAEGNVEGHNMVGGLVGYMVENAGIHNSYYAEGVVRGGYNVGGIAGYVYAYDDGIDHTYFSGVMLSDFEQGGFLGAYYAGALADNYWNTTLNPGLQDFNGGDLNGITGETAAQMQKKSTYQGWDFKNTWIMKDYPELRTKSQQETPQTPKKIQSFYLTVLQLAREAVEMQITLLQKKLTAAKKGSPAKKKLERELLEAKAKQLEIQKLAREIKKRF